MHQIVPVAPGPVEMGKTISFAIKDNKHKCLGEIEDLEKLEEERRLTTEEMCRLLFLHKSMEEIYRMKDLIWKQRAYYRWLREGDANTAFFH